MTPNALMVEQAQIVPVAEFHNVTGGALTSDYVNMENAQRCTFLINLEAGGTAGEDPTLVFLQSTSNAGAGAKAVVPVSVHKKQAATNLASTGQFSDASSELGGSGGNEVTNGTLAEQAALYAVEILAEDMDTDNGFTFLNFTVADTGAGNAQDCVANAILWPSRYGGGSDVVPSALA